MIDMVYVLDADRVPLGIIDTAESIIWERLYYGAGAVEIYAPATPDVIAWFKVGNYLYRGDSGETAIIEELRASYTNTGALMLTAAGRNVKSILDRRLIINYDAGTHSITPTVFSGKVEEAARALVSDNIISSSQAARNVSFIQLGTLAGYPDIITSSGGGAGVKQTSYSNLLEYTDALLEQYKMSGRLTLDPHTGKLSYTVHRGADRSRGNTEGNAPVIFSQEFDNLISSDYDYNETNLKSTAYIGGSGEGTERFFSAINTSLQGMDRREVFIDASSTSRTYMSGGTEQQYSDAQYAVMLRTAGMQKMVDYQAIETFNGVVDLATTEYRLYDDVDLGDVVTVEDNTLGVYINARIIKTTEVQDDAGYTVAVEFGA